MISKHVPPLMGLISLVITSCSLGLGPKVNDALVVLVLVLISTYTKEVGSYLKSRKVVW
jgi:hypothetical protein